MIDVQIDTRAAERVITRGIRSLEKLGRDLRPVLRALRKPVLDDQRDHRKKQEGPDGKWPKLAASTRERYKQMRRAGRKAPRGILGRLPTAFRVRYERKSLVVESIVRWSRAHQDGKGVPERRYYWISRSLLAAARDVVVHELDKAARAMRHAAQVSI